MHGVLFRSFLYSVIRILWHALLHRYTATVTQEDHKHRNRHNDNHRRSGCLTISAPSDRISVLCCHRCTNNICRSSDWRCTATDISSDGQCPCKAIKQWLVCTCQALDDWKHRCCKWDIIYKCTCNRRDPMIIATITYTFPPLTLPMKDAMDFRIPVCSNPPTTINNPMKNNSVL